MEMKENGLVYRVPVKISIYSSAPGASPPAAPNQARTNPTKKNIKLVPCFERERTDPRIKKSPSCQVKIKKTHQWEHEPIG
jgi:hypothetical protein